ncbi:hypothetical protein [Paenibacillus sp. LK1]|uniref:hypothetical protein n=1 Tax=Paenibacillus sp. LK1 TaxID=2053014 RepID=UPI0015D4F65A|nr:hypothetical protein [Paenibacillus sp. LK1]
MMTKDALNGVTLKMHTYDDEKIKEDARQLTDKYKELSESLSDMSVSEGDSNALQ